MDLCIFPVSALLADETQQSVETDATMFFLIFGHLVVHACNPSTEEAEAGQSRVQGQLPTNKSTQGSGIVPPL
jgi:hypothetical protein